jgi:hypothetical protein
LALVVGRQRGFYLVDKVATGGHRYNPGWILRWDLNERGICTGFEKHYLEHLLHERFVLVLVLVHVILIFLIVVFRFLLF